MAMLDGGPITEFGMSLRCWTDGGNFEKFSIEIESGACGGRSTSLVGLEDRGEQSVALLGVCETVIDLVLNDAEARLLTEKKNLIEAARKHGLNQKDFKSATTQAAPVTRKVRTHSDQLKCNFG